MVEWYHSVYDRARKIEGASQRVQEDTIKFSRIMETLGKRLIEALMILVEFRPILYGFSIGIQIFFFVDWDYGLIVGALLWSVWGTRFLFVLIIGSSSFFFDVFDYRLIVVSLIWSFVGTILLIILGLILRLVVF